MFSIDPLRVNIRSIFLLDRSFTWNHFRPGDCSRLNAERHQASLLKANDLQASPLYVCRNRTEPRPPVRSPSPCNSGTGSSTSSAKKAMAKMYDETAMVALFQPIGIEQEIHVTPDDGESRKNIARPLLEAVPEMSELNIDYHQRRRSSCIPPLPSPVSLAKQSHSTQAGPLLVTFDSGSLQRRQWREDADHLTWRARYTPDCSTSVFQISVCLIFFRHVFMSFLSDAREWLTMNQSDSFSSRLSFHAWLLHGKQWKFSPWFLTPVLLLSHCRKIERCNLSCCRVVVVDSCCLTLLCSLSFLTADVSV